MGKLSGYSIDGTLDDTDAFPITPGPRRVLWAAIKAALDARYTSLSPWVTTFAGIVSQHATNPITYAVSKSQWHYDGDMVEWEARLGITGAGTAGNPVVLVLPVAALSASNWSMGAAEFYDSDTAIRHVCVPETSTATTMVFGADQGVSSFLGVSPAITLAAGDQIRFLVRYRWR